MPSKVIRLNPYQIRYLKQLLKEDLDFYEKQLDNETDEYAIDYLTFNSEICKDIISKLQD